jgi:hypothetical protein
MTRMSARRAARRGSSFDDVRKFALALPDVEERTSYGAPAFKLHGRLMACQATNKAAEPGSLVVCIDFADRDELIAAEPDIYYLKDHYVDYACVLVRLSRVHPDALRDLLHAAWRFTNSKARRKGTRRARQPSTVRGEGLASHRDGRGAPPARREE